MGHLATTYLNAVIGLLERVRDEEQDGLEAAAELIAQAVQDGKSIFAFGCSHSSLPVQDIVYRAGGFMLVNPIYAPGVEALTTRPTTLGSAMEQLPGYARALIDNSPLQEGDALIVVSVAGRNALPVEFAELARERGVRVIGLTSYAYTDAVESRVPSGKKLRDVCDVILDNKVAKGDAVLEAEGVPQRFAPASGVTSTAVLHSLVATSIEKLLAAGYEPPVFLAANVDGGKEWNERLMAQNRDRIHYL